MKPQKGKYVSFELNHKVYGIHISSIQEIDQISTGKISPVPKAPPYLRGLINLRGTVIPVLNIKRIMNSEQGDITTSPKIIILGNQVNTVGILVDQILPLQKYSEEELYESPVTDKKLGQYVIGIGKKNGKAVFILDPNQFINNQHQLAS